MKYTARAPEVEAQVVQIDGAEYFAVSSTGAKSLELVLPSRVFAMLYAPAAAPPEPSKPAPKLPRRRAGNRPRSYGAARGVPGPADNSPNLPAAVIRAVRERPRTTGEVIDRVMELVGGSTRGGASSAIHVVKGRGRIEKRRDEGTGLDKWFLVEGA